VPRPANTGSREPRALGLLVVLALGGAFGCRRQEQPAPARESAAPSARPAPSASPPAHPSSAPPPVAVHGCRVLGVKGKAAPAGTPGVGTLLRGKEWLDVADGVELELKHTETTRELSVLGPGRFLVCPDGAEAVSVARGTVRATAGPGSRAGAEVELATPLGVVHYGDAALVLVVKEREITLDVTQGAAAVDATANEDTPKIPAPTPVRAPKGHLSLRGEVTAEALVRRCLTRDTETRLKTLGSVPSAGPERGAWAVQLFEARKSARLVCARARAAVGTLEAAERSRLEDQLTRKDRREPGASPEPANAESDAGK